MDDLHKRGARVVSIFGAFASRVLVEMPVSVAEELFETPLGASSDLHIVTAVESDLSEIGLEESTLAATAVALAYEIANPYNSATAKSHCSKTLRETLDRLRELAAETEEGDDQLDRILARSATPASP